MISGLSGLLAGRVVIWIGSTVGKGFALKAVALTATTIGGALAGIGYKLGSWREKRKRKRSW